MSSNSVAVRIAGKEYRIRSDADEVWLQRVASYVDESFRKIRERTNTVDSLDVAVLAALNLGQELIELREAGSSPGLEPDETDEVRVEGESVTFTPTELRLLHFLASHPGRVFTREHLLSRIIGEDAYVVDRNIDVRIRSVRKKLGKHRDLIETIRGVGYRFQDEES